MFDVDAHMIIFMVIATLATVIFLFFVVVFLITFKNKQNRKSREALVALLAEKDKTMQEISIEIHDNLGAMLYIAKMNVDWLEDQTTDENVPLVQKIGAMLDVLITDAYNIGHALNNDYLKKEGLINSLKEELRWLKDSGKIDCDLIIEGIKLTWQFSGQTELMLLRIAQEAIKNALKYANADKLEIILHYNTHSFEMTIRDNGIGFDQQATAFKSGVGMLSMQQRTDVINGKLSIASAPGKGTAVKISLPPSMAIHETRTEIELLF